MTNIIKAIQKINPNAEVTVNGNDINSIEWLNGTTPIPKTDIEAKMNQMANEPEQSNYAQQRRNAYPEIGDQLDMLWHSIDQDPQLKSKYFNFYEAIKAVKVKYPKNG
jgi:alpha-N-acetylglucosamine transferase